MRITPFDFSYLTRNFDNFVTVIRDRMMRRDANREYCERHRENPSHTKNPPHR